MDEFKTVEEAFDAYVTWRVNLIDALLTDGNSFHKTLDAVRYYGTTRHPVNQWEVDLCDELLPGLPPSSMPLNFTCDEASVYGWLFKFTAHCDAWLLSVALNSKWFGKNDRQSLFKKISNLPTIYDIIFEVDAMKKRVDQVKSNPEAAAECVDEEYSAWCKICQEDASCVFWIWCDTCKKDTILFNCDSCSECPKDICKSCSNNSAKVVRCL